MKFLKCPNCKSIFPPDMASLHNETKERLTLVCPRCSSCFDVPKEYNFRKAIQNDPINVIQDEKV